MMVPAMSPVIMHMNRLTPSDISRKYIMPPEKIATNMAEENIPFLNAHNS